MPPSWAVDEAERRRAERGGSVIAMDYAEDASEANVAQPGAQAFPVVYAAHAKSPCLSPSAAFATRSNSPAASSVSGEAPSSEARSVVSQTQAA